jgi:hypothetical protein
MTDQVVQLLLQAFNIKLMVLVSLRIHVQIQQTLLALLDTLRDLLLLFRKTVKQQLKFTMGSSPYLKPSKAQYNVTRIIVTHD